jgi:hypothetical protein
MNSFTFTNKGDLIGTIPSKEVAKILSVLLRYA